MNADKTHISMVLDRSSSMAPLTNETIAGVNKFVADQQAEPGECSFTLVQFSTDYDFTYKNVALKDAKPLTTATYRPHGWTALLDAMGRCIDETGIYLASLPEHERPAKVVFVVITDGEENRSKEYTRALVAEKVKLQQEKYNWKFVFLGANMDAITVAQSYNIPVAGAANFAATARSSEALYGSFSANVSSYRGGGATGMSWSSEQRDSMTSDSDDTSKP